MLVIAGLALTFGTMLWYGLSERPTGTAGTESGSATGLISKVSTTRKGQGAAQEVTTTTESSDTILIFALTAGVALSLSGAFYGRMREIKLGGLDMTVGDLPEEAKEKLKSSVQAAAASANVSDATKASVETAAGELAKGRLIENHSGVVPKLADKTLDEAAQQAVADVLKLVKA